MDNKHEEAKQALQQSRDDLEKAKRMRIESEQRARFMKQAREENHFGEMLAEAFGRS